MTNQQSHSPVAIAFLDTPPDGVEKWQGGQVPAGCSFWKIAQDGRTFYTVPSDHYNCAVGAHTHAIQQPAERAGVLMDTVGFMVEQSYLQMAEVPGIPVLSKSPGVIAYGPVDAVSLTPDLVVIAANPASAMLLYEAAVRAGAASALTSILGRPACAVLPLVSGSGVAAMSLGCKGNRTFTGLPDGELYVCIPGAKWDAVKTELTLIENANAAMAAHYVQHQAQFAILN